MEEYAAFWQNYVNFSGRTSRRGYWIAMLLNLVISFVLGTVLTIIGLPMLMSLYTIATLIPGIAIGIRRLHDLGKTGIWYLVILVPIVGAILLLLWFCGASDADNVYGRVSEQV